MPMTDEELLALLGEESSDEGYSDEELLALLDDDGETEGDEYDRLSDAQLKALLDAPDDDIPVIEDYEGYAAEHDAIARAQLEQQLAADQQGQAAAQERIDFAEKPAGERALAGLAQGAQQATFLPRAVGNAPSAIGRLMGLDTPNIIPEGDFVPRGTPARTAADLGGDMMAVGMGMTPVARATGDVGSVVADVFGLGSSMGDDAAVMAARTLKGNDAIPEHMANVDPTKKVDINWSNPEEVQSVLQAASDDVLMMQHGDSVAALDEAASELSIRLQRIADDPSHTPESVAALTKAAKEDHAATVKTIEDEVRQLRQDDMLGGATTFDETFDEAAIQYMSRKYDMPHNEVVNHVVAAGGLRRLDDNGNPINRTLEGARQRAWYRKAEDQFTTTGKDLKPKDDAYSHNIVEQWIRPATAVLRESVGNGFATSVEKAFLGANKDKNDIVMKYNSRGEDYMAVTEWAEDPKVKAMYANLWSTGVEGRAAIIAKARAELGEGGVDVVMDMFQDAAQHQNRSKKAIFSKDAKLDTVNWHMRVRHPEPNTMIDDVSARQKSGRGASTADSEVAASAYMRRDRSLLTPAQAASYENPLMSQMENMADQTDIVNLFERLGIPPQLREVTDLEAVATAVQRHVHGVTGDHRKANVAAETVRSILKGSREVASQPLRIFMNQSYAGTLGQVDSAALNIQDVFTSVWRHGPAPTAKAVAQMFTKDKIVATEFGITDAHIGEFREGMTASFDKAMKDPHKTKYQRVMDAAEKGTNAYGKLAFTLSTFKALDLGGKGVIVRAAINDMQRLAKKKDNMGAFREKYGHLFTDRELGEVQKALRAGGNPRNMTPRQLDIVGRAAVARLGEQQLTTSASRTLGYLRNPNSRFLFQMSGFALVQADILKREVFDQIRKGNFKAAGEAAAGWAFWSAGGYVLTDSFRDEAMHQATGNKKKEVTLESQKSRTAEAFMGPLSVNKVGDPYTLQKFIDDPVMATLETAKPAGGYLGNMYDGVQEYRRYRDHDPLWDGEFEGKGFEHYLWNMFPGYGRAAGLKATAEEDNRKLEEKRFNEMLGEIN